MGQDLHKLHNLSQQFWTAFEKRHCLSFLYLFLYFYTLHSLPGLLLRLL
ncbi:E5 [Chipapillomavirus 2]|nr:E5 [Chipapillomavirus 2]